MRAMYLLFFIFVFYEIILCFDVCLAMNLDLNKKFVQIVQKEIRKSVSFGDESSLKRWFSQLDNSGIKIDINELYYDGKSQFQTTLLHSAVHGGYESIVKFLLEHGANPNGSIEWDITPLHYACCYGYKDIVKLLIAHEALLDLSTKRLWTALHYACQKGYADIVRILIEHDASINGKEATLLTPLHVACFHGHVDVVNVLLEYRADTEVFDQELLTPLHLACWKNHPTIVGLLLTAGKQLYNGKVPCINSQDMDKWTPLHMACQSGSIDCAALLIADGAIINIPDSRQWTPLHVAGFYNHYNVVRLLIEHGADVNAQTNLGATVLSLVCQQGNDETCAVLLKYCNIDPWYFDSTDIDCAICLESFCDKDICVRLPCLHVFHVKCVQKLDKKQCRLCRKEIHDLNNCFAKVKFFIFKENFSLSDSSDSCKNGGGDIKSFLSKKSLKAVNKNIK